MDRERPARAERSTPWMALAEAWRTDARNLIPGLKAVWSAGTDLVHQEHLTREPATDGVPPSTSYAPWFTLDRRNLCAWLCQAGMHQGEVHPGWAPVYRHLFKQPVTGAARGDPADLVACWSILSAPGWRAMLDPRDASRRTLPGHPDILPGDNAKASYRPAAVHAVLPIMAQVDPDLRMRIWSSLVVRCSEAKSRSSYLRAVWHTPPQDPNTAINALAVYARHLAGWSCVEADKQTWSDVCGRLPAEPWSMTALVIAACAMDRSGAAPRHRLAVLSGDPALVSGCHACTPLRDVRVGPPEIMLPSHRAAWERCGRWLHHQHPQAVSAACMRCILDDTANPNIRALAQYLVSLAG